MFEKINQTHADSGPLGVQLADLLPFLARTSLKAKVVGNTLVVQHEHYQVVVEVIPPEVRETEDGPIKAVVRIKSELPKALLDQCNGKFDIIATTFNGFAALGALTCEGEKTYVGSRLTIYETEDAWDSLHLPLLAFTTICGSEAIMGGARRSMGGQPPRGGNSNWTASHLKGVHAFLSRVCACNASGLGLTAEFGLAAGAGSAMLGHHNTALFQMMANQPHPELGGGLFCLLNMPHSEANKQRHMEICRRLNTLEMGACGLPPHFGAWSAGGRGSNFAYVSFIPNSLSVIPGIEQNAAIWALNRARLATGWLGSTGVRM